ncbi:protein-lysine methyltransferase METTL21C-like [Scomber scombrus]|uniref:Protein-lysine methyltransferase METTL21C-like n=1 Tax=Scomber scombrus TaxID=13677 RepID=A0AAV1P2H3_SCOSC
MHLSVLQALPLCFFLDDNRQRVKLQEKEVLELGAGTGLVTIVASLLDEQSFSHSYRPARGAGKPQLQCDEEHQGAGQCSHMPKMEALAWGYDLEHTHPTSGFRYNYILAADVVYHHDFLDELLATMKHFCQPGTTLIWANKVRFESDITFIDNFKNTFYTSVLAEDGKMRIFMATCRE